MNRGIFLYLLLKMTRESIMDFSKLTFYFGKILIHRKLQR